MQYLGFKMISQFHVLSILIISEFQLGNNLKCLFYISLSIIVILLVVVIFQIKTIHNYRKQAQIVDKMLISLNFGCGLKQQLNSILEIIISRIEAGGYYFYLFNEKEEKYVLYIKRYVTSTLGINGVSYSGLVPYEKEKYNPSFEIKIHKINSDIRLIKDGDVQLLQLCIAEGKGLIRAGPVKKISLKQNNSLIYILRIMNPLMNMILEMDKLNNDIKRNINLSKEINDLSKTELKINDSGNKIIATCSQALKASGYSIGVSRDNIWGVPISTQYTKEENTNFNIDGKVLEVFYRILADKPYLLISPETKEYYAIPLYLVASGIQSVLIVPLNEIRGMAIFWFNNTPVLENKCLKVVEMMNKQLIELWKTSQIV